MSTKPFYSIISMAFLNDYCLMLDFADGTNGTFDFTPLLDEKLYAPLRNKGLFRKAKIVCGGIAWTDEIDINPEFLYDNSVKS